MAGFEIVLIVMWIFITHILLLNYATASMHPTGLM